MNEFKINVVIAGMSELTAAINRLAGLKDSSAVQSGIPMQQTGSTYMQPAPAAAMQASSPMPQGQVPLQAPPAAPQGQIPMQAPPIPQGQIPAQAPVPAPQGQPQSPLPTAAPAQGFTLEQLQVAAAGLMSTGKGQQVMGILQQFGIQAMTELPKERYGEFAMVLREAGAQI